MACIESIGTALPRNRYSTGDICRFLQKGADEKSSRKLQVLLSRSGIEARYSVLPDFSQSTVPELFERKDPSVEKRMKIFAKHAPALALEAISDCLSQSKVKKREITHLITVSCTGMSAPGLEISLSTALGLPDDVVKLAVNFMGCYGVFHALKMARYIIGADPTAKVLIASVELCSIHFQACHDDDNLLANALFGDGSAACMVTNKGGLLELDRFYQKTIPDRAADMAWEIDSKGFLLKLSSYVPKAVGAGITEAFQHLPGLSEIRFKDPVYAIHPGGKNILAAVASALAVPVCSLAASYAALAEHGNLSSATILFVLKKLSETGKGRPLFAAGFGPGLTMEMFTGKIC